MTGLGRCLPKGVVSRSPEGFSPGVDLDHSLALTSTGTVLAWGLDSNGELGNAKRFDSNLPVKVKLPPGSKVTALAAGFEHSLALSRHCRPGVQVAPSRPMRPRPPWSPVR